MFEIVVGIPSHNEETTITHVTEVAGEGLEEYFPGRKSIIVNVDNNSTDNTREAFLDAKTGVEKRYISTKPGVLGKGNNFLNLFDFAKRAEAEIVIVMDADLRSVKKEWIEYLGRPVADGFDYVVPLYSRHQFDGTISNHICYPVMFAMLSMDIRQPIGGEFAFSPKLMHYWLKQPWPDSVKQYGIDIFMSLNAVLGGFKICQSGLGTKVHKASTPKLGIMFEEVVKTLLNLLVENKAVWMNRENQTVTVPEISGLREVTEPQEIDINVRDLKEQCQKSYRKYGVLIKKLLEPYAFSRVDEMFRMDAYNIDILLWGQIFYKLLFQYDHATNNKERREVICALKPLYFARSLSFNYDTWKYNIKYAEMEIRNQALGFASQKYYLWGLYDR